jgi:hypothetical protein
VHETSRVQSMPTMGLLVGCSGRSAFVAAVENRGSGFGRMASLDLRTRYDRGAHDHWCGSSLTGKSAYGADLEQWMVGAEITESTFTRLPAGVSPIALRVVPMPVRSSTASVPSLGGRAACVAAAGDGLVVKSPYPLLAGPSRHGTYEWRSRRSRWRIWVFESRIEIVEGPASASAKPPACLA